jgi:DNA modification methylase
MTGVVHGDCLVVMGGMDECSVDSIVTDPPYGLKFMGKEWDHGVPGEPFWREALRVAKPGCMMLAFGGTRTFHRLTCAIEDAGWEIRDCLMWLYGSGFPKSLNVGKATGQDVWLGWGTALKPAWEPIILAMKPLDGTFAHNAQTHGVAGLNVDGCRIGTKDDLSGGTCGGVFGQRNSDGSLKKAIGSGDKGRWPANLVLDEEAGAMLDEQSGVSKSGVAVRRNGNSGKGTFPVQIAEGSADVGFNDTGGASRFFYCPKASKKDRGEDNKHPTVKPTALMRYLCRLVTPPGGIVLDPFCGSGSTGKAAKREGFRFIGIDKDKESCEIARARISSTEGLLFGAKK